MCPLGRTCKTLRHLAPELSERGQQINHLVVGKRLRQVKSSLLASRKTRQDDSDLGGNEEETTSWLLPGRWYRKETGRGRLELWRRQFNRIGTRR